MFVMEQERKNGKMVLSMKANGKMVWLTEKEYLSIKMVINMRESSFRTKQMVRVNIFTVMVNNTLENGKTIRCMDKVKRY